jgi:hypothetical protein
MNTSDTYETAVVGPSRLVRVVMGPLTKVLNPACCPRLVPANRLSAGLPVIVPVVVRVIAGVRSALTGRVGRHSTAGLAVVAAAGLAPAQLEEGVGRGHPQLHREGRVVGGPVGQQGPRVWSWPGFLTGIWHNAHVTTNAARAPVPSSAAAITRATPMLDRCRFPAGAGADPDQAG